MFSSKELESCEGVSKPECEGHSGTSFCFLAKRGGKRKRTYLAKIRVAGTVSGVRAVVDLRVSGVRSVIDLKFSCLSAALVDLNPFGLRD